MPIDRRDIKTLSIAALVLAVFGSAIWLPAFLQRRDLQKRIDTAEQALQTDLRDAQFIQPVQAQLTATRAALDAQPHHVPAQDDVDQVLRSLTEALEAFDLHQQEILTRSTRDGGTFRTTPVSMRFAGSFPATFGVLQHIESMNRLIRIDRVHLEPESSALGEASRVTVQLSTFFSNDPEAH